MVDSDRLRGLIRQHRLTQEDVAKYLGIGSSTLYRKLKQGQFGTDECEKLIELLEITDPSIFFSNLGNSQVTTKKW